MPYFLRLQYTGTFRGVLDFLWLKHEKHFCTQPLATPLDCTGQQKHQDGGKQNGKSPCNLKMISFAEIIWVGDHYVKSSWFLSGILNENLEMHGVEGNTFFRTECWIKGN